MNQNIYQANNGKFYYKGLQANLLRFNLMKEVFESCEFDFPQNFLVDPFTSQAYLIPMGYPTPQFVNFFYDSEVNYKKDKVSETRFSDANNVHKYAMIGLQFDFSNQVTRNNPKFFLIEANKWGAGSESTGVRITHLNNDKMIELNMWCHKESYNDHMFIRTTGEEFEFEHRIAVRQTVSNLKDFEQLQKLFMDKHWQNINGYNAV